MPVLNRCRRSVTLASLLVLVLGLSARAQGQCRIELKPANALAGLDSQVFMQAVYEAERTAAQEKDAHPLLPIIRYAFSRYQSMSTELQDYRCRLVKRERIAGRLQSHQFMAVKVRHQPAADGSQTPNIDVYLRFLAPSRIKGREVLYVEGENNGELLATKGGHGALKHFTISTALESDQALRDSLYPVNQIGVLNLTRRLIEDGVKHMQADVLRECVVVDKTGATIDDRPCRFIEVTFPAQRSGIRFHKAQIFIDEKLQIPVRYASYDWPQAEGEPPRLLEEYTYADLELNPGLADLDFRRDNPDYHFHARQKKTREEK